MIQTLTCKDPNKVKLPKGAFGGDATPNYAFSLDSIKGKTFEFKPGVNIIVGANGCGKTSLLNIIRHLTFCDELYYSSIAGGRECWELHVRNSYDECYWHLAEMKAQYSASTFNLRKANDYLQQDFAASTVNFAQMMRSHRRSEGQNVMDAINMMMIIHTKGEEALREKDESKLPKIDEKGFLPHHYFKNTVLKIIEKSAKRDDDYWGTMYKTLLQYYKDNNITSKEDKKKYSGFTFLMDEPDKGMDVFNVEQLYNFIVNCPAHYQHILVLHNIGMIHKLKEWGGANFIEMSEGYLDKVEEFFE